MSCKGSWGKAHSEKPGWHVEGRYVIDTSIFIGFSDRKGACLITSVMRRYVLTCGRVCLTCSTLRLTLWTQQEEFRPDKKISLPQIFSLLQDGKIFVVKIMHGASLTEKAKEEVLLLVCIVSANAAYKVSSAQSNFTFNKTPACVCGLDFHDLHQDCISNPLEAHACRQGTR